MDGNRRLKKLFRSSKSGGIDPLPSPDSSTPTASSTPTSTIHTVTNISNSTSFSPTTAVYSLGNSAAANSTSSFGASSAAPIHDMHKRRQQQPQNSVTPFPIDAGRGDSSGVIPSSAAPRRPADGRDPNWDVRNVTLAEMAQMEEEAASAPYRREGGAIPRPRSGTGSSIPPLDSTSWVAPSGTTAPSPVSQPGFYLPPGAGPPSPQIRPSTPPARMMQQNLNNVSALPPPQAAFVEGEAFPNARARGYSSASQNTRHSDHDNHIPPVPAPKLAKPAGPPGSNRSPLANSYSEHQAVAAQPQVAGKYASWQGTPMGSERSTPGNDMERMDRSGPPSTTDKTERPERNEKEKEKKRFWNWGQPKHKDKDRYSKESPREREQRELREAQAQREREVQGQREREAQQQLQRDQQLAAAALIPSPPPVAPQPPQLVPPALAVLNAQMTRASIDDSRASHDERHDIDPVPFNDVPSSIGHDDEGRSRTREVLPEGNDVGSAIRRLAGSRETTHGAVLDVCERVNASHSGEAVGKEAARTMRKILKSGSDAERRMALRIWWITMRNINVRGFRHYATNRKFMTAVEPIVTQQLKPPPSMSTLKACRDILSDLTFCHYKERGCEGLYELWKRVKQPSDPEFGKQLPDDYLKHGSSGSTAPVQQVQPTSTPGATTPTPSPAPNTARRLVEPAAAAAVATAASKLAVKPTSNRPGSPGGFGPSYASLPDHHEDMRRLIEECTAAKESARVLAEALVYTRPEELEHKGVIKEFYTKCVLAHESLTNQMEWAGSEAAKSRRVFETIQTPAEGQVTTVEESALALLFEAHSLLTDSLKQYDDLEKMAMDDRELRAVQERSKKDTRMDRRQQMDMLMAGDGGAQASSSRSPSPALRTAPLPDEDRPESKTGERISPVGDVPQSVNHHLSSVVDDRGLSRTPSPDGGRRSITVPAAQVQAALAAPPKKMSSPTRTDSPLGRSRIPGPRPLPNPFRSVSSSQNLAQIAATESANAQPRSGNGGAFDGSHDGDEQEEMRPSRKALGKRRADPDMDFDPDEMFKEKEVKADTASDHSITADDVYFDRPVVYAYDAWAESEQVRREKGQVPSEGCAKTDDGVDSLKRSSANSTVKDVLSKSAIRPSTGNGNGNSRAPAEVAAR